MGHRPVDLEPTPNETLSRPAELVQRAKQLAQLANFQFGRGTVPTPAGVTAAINTNGFTPRANGAPVNRVAELGLDQVETSVQYSQSNGSALATAIAPSPVKTHRSEAGRILRRETGG